jgi:two-component system sensor histidine kinase DevS
MLVAMVAQPASGPRRRRDPEERALRRLARATARGIPEKPVDALEQVAGLARALTRARYAALVVVGERDYVEGFVVSGLTAEEERKLKAPPQGHGPLGTMRQDGLPVRIDDLGEYGSSFGFPPRHPEMKTLLGVPVWAGGAVRGALYVTDRNGGRPFRAEDEVALRVLARHAGNVISTRWY